MKNRNEGDGLDIIVWLNGQKRRHMKNVERSKIAKTSHKFITPNSLTQNTVKKYIYNNIYYYYYEYKNMFKPNTIKIYHGW